MAYPESNRKRRRGSLTGSVAALSIEAARMASKSSAAEAGTLSDGASNTSTLQHSKLLELPAEVLLQITTHLCGTPTIINMAVANKKLRGITTEAMAKSLSVPPNRIKQAIEMLTRRPELISKVNSIDLGAYMAAHTKDCVCTSGTVFDRKARRIFRNGIPASTNGQVTWNQLQQSKRKWRWLWSPNHRFFMEILLTLCPNVKEVTMQMPKVVGFDRSPATLLLLNVPAPTPTPNPEFRPRTLFQGLALRVMQDRLQTLTIPPNSKWIGPVKQEVLMIENDKQWRRHGKNIITFKGFHKLKHLDLPMDLLGLPASVVVQGEGDPEVIDVSVSIVTERLGGGGDQSTTMILPAKVLPLSLTTLRLRACTKHTFALLQRINEIPVSKLNLKHIDLYLQTLARSHILLCYREDRGRLDYLDLLNSLSAKGITITFYTSESTKPTDMRRELLPLYYISPCDAGLVTLANKPFAALNIPALRRRRACLTTHKLFIQHATTHFDLLNNPTFDGTYWESAAFFHGVNNSRYDPCLRDKDDEEVVHVVRNSSHLDDRAFRFEVVSRVDGAAKTPRAVVFDSRIFSLMNGQAGDVGMHGEDQVHKKAGSDAKKAECERSSSPAKGQPEGRRSRKRGEKKERERPLLICFKGAEDGTRRIGRVGVFDAKVWGGVEWKVYLQPYVEKM